LGAQESGGEIILRFGPESVVTKGTLEQVFKGFNVEVMKQRSIHTTLGADPRMVQSFRVSFWDEGNRLSPTLAKQALQERLGGEQRFTTKPIRQRLEKAGVLPGMEGAVREQKAAARALEGEKLGEEFARPVGERAGKQIVEAPIFRGTEAAPQREMFAPRGKGKRTYDEVQKEIDAFEGNLEARGVDITKLADSEAVARARKIGVEPGPRMPSELDALYRERNAIGGGELSESLADLQGRLANNGIRGKDAEVVLEYYSLRPGKVEAIDQYFAAEYTEKFARMPFKKQVEGVAIKLAARRGEQFDAFEDVSATSRADAAKAVTVIREYFGAPKPQTVMEAIRKSQEGRKPVFDEFGDEIVRGKTVVDSMGRTLQVDSVNAEQGNLTVRYQGRRQQVPIAEVTVKRHGRPKALEGIGRKPVRHFGESEEAFGARVNRERGFIRGKDLLPGEWLESLGDIGRGIKDIITRSKTKTKTVSPESPELNEARINVGRQFEKRQQ
ncbi:hypothetical protein LCGC14_2497860, partial [marine sediment metagenome]